MRILVCGGRDYGQSEFERGLLNSVLGAFLDRWRMENVLTPADKREFVIIAGGARGADTLAANWCRAMAEAFEEIPSPIIEPANWTEHGRAAGPIRNQKMLDAHKPTQVIAFPGGNGTEDMIKKARAHGIPIFVIRYE